MDEQPEWLDISRRLRPHLLNKLGSPADADDALQNALIRIHRGLGGLGQPERLIPWMYRIAQNAAIDQLRDRSRHPVAREGAGEETVAPAAEEDPAIARDVANYVASLVSVLDEPYRTAVELTEIEGMTQKAAAEAQGVSLTAMKSRVQRGREKLRRELERCCTIALDGRRRVVDCKPRQSGNDCC
jgi:RNA polymerase sigma-70 factor (ECF subfamily)